ncbi:MAG TPA: carbohydrate ABC transporter permease [Pseudothermotoga sp.]|nr:carbohydrate ABC transporter permease [Pseudothermotoga sp.]HOK83477.1 carbohydrate ABC transporter permease [Pseudothermotoga sp.]HPP69550.1 carbohydrate ABC transporter permease [Pseudothermotoga sp.]
MSLKKYLLTILAIALSLIYLVPLIWMALASFQSQKDILAGKWMPSKWSTDNYRIILQRAKIGTWFVNSLISSSVATIGIVVICTLAAYTVSRMDFPGRRFLYILSLTGFMIPSQAIAIPLYLMVRRVGLVNNLLGIILPALPSSMAVFILSQFMKAIPADYEEAARLDGASELDIMFKIILPMSIPSIITVAVLHFTWIWNDFFWPLIVMTNEKMYTLPVGLVALAGSDVNIRYGPIMAANVMASLPVIVVYLFMQRYLTRGVVLSLR